MFVEARDREAGLAVWILGPPSSGEADHEAFVAASRGLEQTSRHPHPALILIVDRGFPPPNAGWRKRYAESTPQTRPGSLFAFVSSSAIARGVYTALNWLRPPPYIHASFDDVEHAERWIESVRGPTPELRALVARARSSMAPAR